MRTLDHQRIERALCESMCADVRLHPRTDGRIMVESPFVLPDGDTYPIFLQPLPGGGVRITDAGLTMMRMSYEMDLDKLKGHTRAAILADILAETSVSQLDGELFIDSPADDLGRQLFTFGQAITRVFDLTLWQRARVASTFMEDLYDALREIVAPDRIFREYVVPNVERAEINPVDFFLSPDVPTKPPLYLFGVPTTDKAKLATIVLQHLKQHAPSFESLLVFHDYESIGKRDFARLLNAGGESVTLDAKDQLRQKVEYRVH